MEPITMSAVTTMASAMGTGMASEAGRRLVNLLGGLVGLEERAPDSGTDWGPLVQVLCDQAREDPETALRLAHIMAMTRSTLTPPTASRTPRLPPGTPYFENHRAPLRRLAKEAGRRPGTHPRAALLHGPPGIGTTGLAVEFGRSEARRFPDGCLYVDLRSDPDASAALRQALVTLGVPEQRIAAVPARREAEFAELVAGRRMLVVLDHARSAAQVRPLLTASPSVFTVVVARRPLVGLDAASVEVEPLAPRNALRLLTRVAGKQAVDALGDGVDVELERCGGRPRAIRLVGAGLVTAPPDEEARTVTPDDPLHAAADRAYRALDPDVARLHRRCALWPWPALRSGPAAAAAQIGEDEAALALEELAGRGLLEGDPVAGYRHPPAVRRHAEEAAMREERVAGCLRAVERTVRWYVDLAVDAGTAALSQRWQIGATQAPAPGRYADPGAALAALGAELDGAVQAVLAAREYALGDTACVLVQGLWPIQLKDGRHEQMLPALRAGVEVAEDVCPNTRMAGRMYTFLASALIEMREYSAAEAAARSALAAEEHAGHLRGRATATETLGRLRLVQWRYEDADELFVAAGRILDGIGPGDEGAADLPRFRALLDRHRGRARTGQAMRGLRSWDDPEQLLLSALRFFRGESDGVAPETYNAARTLTDLAELYFFSGRREQAVLLTDDAIRALEGERAEYHVAHLRALRRSCVGGPDLPEPPTGG
ncbi:Regulatory protein AfsR [Streptomyces sp. YIM 130001]|uniref:tetratricopeptide repeat protein n=1 Tax=Streptomyces sp. YIM 130001 TaxID=2259644 RepID=UPI000E651321|nr:tetratricopeptide repeat protein [Streptomyces sp. YIM 130001]RII19549.1 Regulatory protein AfsR [Streptomyces sp. YIM 130001]